MKKKLVIMLAAVMLMGTMAGCGENTDGSAMDKLNKETGIAGEEQSVENSAGEATGETTEYPALIDFNVEDYVTLGEYMGLPVTVEKAETVTEEHAQELAHNAYKDALSMATGIVVEDGIKDRAVVEGDVVNIDYVGKLNDVAFDGGTAEKAYLGIGYGMFIDGFEEGLVGVKPGETIDLDLTFPETYGNAELAGQAVVFTVTVNYIMPEGYHPDVVALLALEGVTDQASLEKYSYDYLVETVEANQNMEVQSAVIEIFMDGCSFEEVPEIMIEKYEAAAKESMEATATMYGMDVNTLAVQMYGMSYDQLIAEIVPETAKRDMAIQALANKENLNLTDAELDELLTEEMSAYEYTDVNAFLTDVGSSREDFREYYLYDKVVAFLAENAKIIE